MQTTNRCQRCGREGTDVSSYQTYSSDKRAGFRWEWQCDDYEACLDRKYAKEIEEGTRLSSLEAKCVR